MESLHAIGFCQEGNESMTKYRNLGQLCCEWWALRLAPAIGRPIDADTFEKITMNMSTEAVAELKTVMGQLGPTNLSDVEEVQQEIVGLIRKLEGKGEISIPRASAD